MELVPISEHQQEQNSVSEMLCVLSKTGTMIMSRNSIIVLIYRRHKLLYLISRFLLVKLTVAELLKELGARRVAAFQRDTFTVTIA
jgi:hypothetical protein